MHAIAIWTSRIVLVFASLYYGPTTRAQLPSTPPDAPVALAAWIDAGKITWELYDRKPEGLMFDGETYFEIKVDYKFRTQLRPIRENGIVAQQVSVAFFSIDAFVENRVRLPKALVTGEFWQSRLVLHELQHVRITSDPRVPLLVKTLLRRGCQLNFPANALPSESHIKDEIAKHVDATTKSVSDLVQANNALLDQLTQHGLELLDGDPQFFNRLYTETNLNDQQFPKIDDVRALLKTKQYRQLSGSQ